MLYLLFRLFLIEFWLETVFQIVDDAQMTTPILTVGKLLFFSKNWIFDQTVTCLTTIPNINLPTKRLQLFILASDDQILTMPIFTVGKSLKFLKI